MIPRCRLAVDAAAKAVGREAPTEAQYQHIEDSLSAAMRRLARTDTERWQTLSRDQQMQEGAASVMADIAEAAALKKMRAQLQIVKVAETAQRIDSLRGSYKDTPGHSGTYAEALKRDFNLTHVQIAAERKFALGSMIDLIEAAGDKKGAGMGQRMLMMAFDAENPGMTRDIVKEIFKDADGHTGNSTASTAARAWLDTIEKLRTRFNEAGGDVGKLDYGYVPQPHDTSKVRAAGVDLWVEKTAPLLDRSRYLLEDGSRMSDDALKDTLRAAYETLSTEGLNKQEPGAFKGSGSRANRGSDSRQIHFADGEAWATYMRDFGRGSIYDAMMGHVSGMVRDIGLVERYGPDATATARLQFDLSAMADGTQPTKLVGAMSINPQTYWDMISGKVGAPVDTTLANTFSLVRNLQTAAKLGGAVISSVNDLGTVLMNTGYNKLPYWQLIQDIGSQASKETREWMSVHGMIAESTASEINRWSGDHLGTNWSGKLAGSVLKWSLLNAWTDGLRQGFTMSMNAGLARMAKMGWSALDEFDRVRLTRAGITEADWAVLNTVPPAQFKGRELLTPQAIKASGHPDADAIAAKVFGLIHDESEFAVVNPDLATRAVITAGGAQAGTWGGEIARTVMQFKSFPTAMVTRHWGRMLEGNLGATDAPVMASRTAYGFALMATMTGLGAIAVQEKEILKGKDPIDMSKGRFWAKALAQGGGLSIAGDMFLVDPASSSTDSATTAIKNLAGPTIGTVTDLVLKNITENVWQASEGKDTHWEAELFAWGKAQTPGGNLWWFKPFVEHGFTNAVNESLSPGYLSRIQQRGQKDYGQKYWWAPRDAMPDRAPDLSAAIP
jgi:hypothetical protein